jgi:hypothetical protein
MLLFSAATSNCQSPKIVDHRERLVAISYEASQEAALEGMLDAVAAKCARLTACLTLFDLTLQLLASQAASCSLTVWISFASSTAVSCTSPQPTGRWRGMELTVRPYKEAKDTWALGSTEEVAQLLEDSLIALAAISASRYVGGVRWVAWLCGVLAGQRAARAAGKASASAFGLLPMQPHTFGG